jgi:hypothetical protein
MGINIELVPLFAAITASTLLGRLSTRCWPFPNCCHKVSSRESSWILVYTAVLRFPFTGTKGTSLNHEKQPKTIIPLPPNFTVGNMYWGM